jgi:hypothetical protein
MKCDIVELEILLGVIMEEEILGLIPSSKYVDHDITDEKKFSEILSSKYLKRYISTKKNLVMIEPEIWETSL